MKKSNRRWLVAWILVLPCLSTATNSGKEMKSSAKLKEENGLKNIKEGRGIFSPRMDYQQWTPLGMGDPLKNDPTYDYVPPVLDEVRYWIDPENRHPDHTIPEESKKTEILLLGITSKKPNSGTSTSSDYNSRIMNSASTVENKIADSRKGTLDAFLKMVDAPKFNMHNSYQKFSKPHFNTNSYYSSNNFNHNKHKPDQRMPYTMLVPPPYQSSDNPSKYKDENNVSPPPNKQFDQITSQSPQNFNTKSAVTVEHANIIYQSSSYGDANEFKTTNQQNMFGSFPSASSQIIYKTNKPSINSSSVNFVISPPNLMSVSSSSEKSGRNNSGKILTGFVQNSFFSSPNDSSEGPEFMRKGQVTDDDLGLANTYVNIGKAEAQMQPPSGISGISIKPPKISVAQPPIVMNIRPHSNSMSTSSNFHNPIKTPMEVRNKVRPVTLQVLQTMQTMQPPFPPSSSFTNPDSRPISMMSVNHNNRIPNMNINENHKPEKPSINALHFLLKTEKPQMETSTFKPIISLTTTAATTTAASLPPLTNPPSTTTTEENILMTTDPLFKHYKQPTEPIKGPFYLIIQGHSKVKTYGPNKQFHGINIQETNEIPTTDEKSDFTIKHLHHSSKKNSVESFSRAARSGNLQTLSHVVQTGYGAIDLRDSKTNRRKDNDIQEAELGFRYDVSEMNQITSEKYHKGIVEAGDMSRKLKEDVHQT